MPIGGVGVGPRIGIANGIALPRIVSVIGSDLSIVADAAAALQGGIDAARIVSVIGGDLAIVAGAAAALQSWIDAPRVVGVVRRCGGRLALRDRHLALCVGYIQLVARTDDNRCGAKIARGQALDLNRCVTFCLPRYKLKRLSIDIDAVIISNIQ